MAKLRNAIKHVRFAWCFHPLLQAPDTECILVIYSNTTRFLPKIAQLTPRKQILQKSNQSESKYPKNLFAVNAGRLVSQSSPDIGDIGRGRRLASIWSAGNSQGVMAIPMEA
jgi:hypothetical protein